MASIDALLAHLDRVKPTAAADIAGWQVVPVSGGSTNLLYHATGSKGDYAIKFTLRDARRRAEREYYTLALLHRTGQPLAPFPVLLDQDSYSLPVIVQSWLEGNSHPEPPQTDHDWYMLLNYLARLHSISPEQFASHELELSRPVLYAESAADCKRVILEAMALLPTEAQPKILRQLFARFEALTLPEWDAPALAPVRSDPNPRNFIRRAGDWTSVDWENSGISDPAFDIADMIAHAAYIDVPRSRWEWVIEQYCALRHDRNCEIRIRAYWRTLALWWVIRFARYFYEIPRGLDARLVERPPDWREIAEAKYRHYLALADELL